MQVDEVKQLLSASIEDCQFDVQIDGSHYFVTAVGAVFDGLNRVKKQQLVYSALNDKIADGTIHALHIKAFTPAEWDAQA